MNEQSEVWPLVSAVVATRDRPEMLRRALRSILDQDYAGPIEITVVYDQDLPEAGLVEDLDDQLRADRTVRVITNDRVAGLAGARNSGIAASRGTFLAFCDDDDEWLAGKLTVQVDALRMAPDRWFTAGGYVVDFNGKINERLSSSEDVTFESLLDGRVASLHPSTFVIRAAELAELGPVDEDLPGGYGEDYDLLLRAARVAPILSIRGPLARVYWHSASFFSDRWRLIIEANDYLLAKHPEFADAPRSAAWVQGKTAFAWAAVGERKTARSLARSVLKVRPTQKQALAALLMSTGVVRADQVQHLAQRFGKGV